MNIDDLQPDVARQIIETVGGHGTPPEWGFQYFTSGLDEYLQVIEDDYLRTYVARGGSSFKLVIGAYGGGKTHFLYNIRELAWKHDYVVSYVMLRHDESPFHQMDKVYKAIAGNLMYPMKPEEILRGGEKGIGAFLKVWFQRTLEKIQSLEASPELVREALDLQRRSATHDVESANFAKAIRAAFTALAEERPEDFDLVVQWLMVEGYDRVLHREFGILRPIERSSAFSAIRSLVQWVRNLEYKGLVILLDEAEQVPSMSSRQREIMLSNLRELIDECGQSSFRNVMIFYAVPNESFLEGQSHVYEALKQRVTSVFEFFNPSGVRLYLERLTAEPLPVLADIGTKLAAVFQQAYGVALDPAKVHEAVDLIAAESFEQRFGDIGYKRLFVQGIVRAFHYLRRRPDEPIDEAWIHRMLTGGE
jgi:hypothetical protein